MATASYKIRGLDCAEEVAALKAELAPIPGVRDLAFDVLSAKMTVVFAENTVTAEDIAAAVARTGMRALPWEDSSQGPPQTMASGIRAGRAFVCLGRIRVKARPRPGVGRGGAAR